MEENNKVINSEDGEEEQSDIEEQEEKNVFNEEANKLNITKLDDKRYLSVQTFGCKIGYINVQYGHETYSFKPDDIKGIALRQLKEDKRRGIVHKKAIKKEKRNEKIDGIKCKWCDSINIRFKRERDNKKQYYCNECKQSFTI